MADIFISYARPDRSKAEQLASALEGRGFSVWWDRHIEGGAQFARDIERELNGAKSVIVVWSAAARISDWVQDEAIAAREQGKLLPVSLDSEPPPMGFKQYHTIDLSQWGGDPAAPAIDDLARVVNAQPVAPNDAEGRRPGVNAAQRSGRYALLAGASLLAAVILATTVILTRNSDSAAPRQINASEPATKAIDPSSIAVLPFADLSPDRDQEYFADGIAEEILHLLARAPQLKVAGRTSSFKFKGVNEDLRVIGEQLGVALILEGSVRKQNNRVRVTAQLIKVEDGFHLWSETFDRQLDDIFAIQDDIAQAVAAALPGKIGRHMPRRAVAETSVPAAHDIYLRARQLLATRDPVAMRQAAELFQSATVLDPQYAAAHAGRGRTLSALLYFDGQADVGQAMAQAEAAAQRALAIDPDNAEAHAVVAQINWFFRWDWRAADAAMTRAVALAPNDAEMVNFAGDHFRYRGDFAKALRYEIRATELNPLHAINFADLGYLYLNMGRCDQALEAANRALAISPELNNAMRSQGYAQICLGDFAAARSTATAVRALGPAGADFALAIEAELAAASNDITALKATLSRFETLELETGLGNFKIAYCHAVLGDYERAAVALEKAYTHRDVMLIVDYKLRFAEDWPDHPAIRAALDKPELNALFAIRKNNAKLN